jgi:hypothetical protein
MIYESGHQKPTKRQLAHVREEADDSFCQTPSSERFDYAIPCPPGYTFEENTVTLLSLKNVEPHEDPWVGSIPSYVGDHVLPPGWTHDGPEGRRAMFWVVDLPKFHELFLQCGAQAKRMRAGDWVVFDDRVLHCVLSTRKWYGCAYQLIPRALHQEMMR